MPENIIEATARGSDAQSLRREGKLARGREQLRMCSDPKSPGLVATDCTKRLDERESVQPSIVFEVKDSAGRDLSEVALTKDGASVSCRAVLDGQAGVRAGRAPRGSLRAERRDLAPSGELLT